MKVILAKSAGFCFGVKRAVDIAHSATATGSEEIYSLGSIIHNDHVVQSLAKRGLVCAETESEIPDSSKVVIRAHGVSPSQKNTLLQKNCEIIDATCPFVEKIHNIVSSEYANGRRIVIIGSPTHPEVMGINGCANNEALIFNTFEELEKHIKENGIEALEGSSVVAQTTIKTETYEKCINLIKNVCTNVQIFDTICNATLFRQEETAALAARCDAMVVIGDRKSSNTSKLLEICNENCRYVWLLESAEDVKKLDLNSEWTVGVTAGASTPAAIIEEVLVTMNEEKTIEQSFEEMLEQSFKFLNTGDIVHGVVTSVNSNEAYVDLGTKHAGIIHFSEFSLDTSIPLDEALKPGDELDLFVMKVNDAEGTVMLSKKRVDSVKGWGELEKAYENGDVLEGVVVSVIKGGLLVNVLGTNIFVPASQSGEPREADLNKLIRKTVKLKVTELNKPRRRLIGSIKAVANEARKALAKKVWEEIEVGKKYKGIVKSITSYGAFVDIGGVDGLVHITELSWKKVKHPSEVVKVGETIDVSVISFDTEKSRISLGHKNPDENPWVMLKEKYTTGDICESTVVSTTPFGAFVRLVDGIDGLIHISNLSNQRVARPEEVVKVGDKVTAKILDIDYDNKKVSLSIRALMEENMETEEESKVETEEAPDVTEKAPEVAEKAPAKAKKKASDKVEEVADSADELGENS